MNELPTRHYTAAGGVVVSGDSRRVLVLLRPGRLAPDGLPEVRLPKGHVKPEESDRQAALREVVEEAGLSSLEIVADLGHQEVTFDYGGYHVVRDEHYYLMTVPAGSQPEEPEAQFKPLWLPWEDAMGRLTFRAEREWLRRAGGAAARP